MISIDMTNITEMLRNATESLWNVCSLQSERCAQMNEDTFQGVVVYPLMKAMEKFNWFADVVEWYGDGLIDIQTLFNAVNYLVG